MKDFILVVSIVLAFLILREAYHLLSKNYAARLNKKFSDIYNKVSQEETKDWIICHVHYLSLIQSDRYQCSIVKIRRNFLKDLELGACCNVIDEQTYEDLKTAIFSYK